MSDGRLRVVFNVIDKIRAEVAMILHGVSGGRGRARQPRAACAARSSHRARVIDHQIERALSNPPRFIFMSAAQSSPPIDPEIEEFLPNYTTECIC